MYCKLLTTLNQDITVLTPNSRIADYLLREFDQLQIQAGHQSWATPKIAPLNAWLREQYLQDHLQHGMLLSDFEEQLIWQSIIRNNDNDGLVLQLNNTAQLAKQAWQTLTQWEIKTATVAAQDNQEVMTFLQWSEIFEQLKQDKQWHSSCELSRLVRTSIENKQVTLNKKIILVGFEDIPPITKSLFAQIETQSELEYFNGESLSQSIQRIELTNKSTEILTMAQWAKKKWEHNKKQKIACVVPTLTQDRQQVIRIFSEVFAAHNIIPGQQQETLPFDISAGQALAQFPIIQSALTILRCFHKEIKTEDLSQLLLSPYINSTQQAKSIAAQADIICRDAEKMTLTLEEIEAILFRLKTDTAKQASVAERFKAFFALQQEYSAEKPFYAWARKFYDILTTLGWPGERTLNSQEYQVNERFNQLLEEFSTLDRILPPQNKADACNIFATLCKQTIFQMQTDKQPIQILGLLEASGNAFDALWLMGLDNKTWPAAANPNPFLPIALQRDNNMPHASAARELDYSKKIQAQLLQSTTETILSAPLHEDDKNLTPSQLILHYNNITLDTLSLAEHQTLSDKIFKTGELETITDACGPPVTATEKIQGGSWILQQQSICPFRAFVSIRLNATAMGNAEIGISAKDRGIITHEALERIWKTLKTQHNLLNQSAEQLDDIVEQSITHSLKNYRSAYVEIERLRLRHLLADWLALEKERPAFKVREQETRRHIHIGKLALNIQIDRIDELNDGQQLIIDYKTGANNTIYDWLSDRPQQTQLPLYCVYGSEQSVGLAYGIVKNSALQFKGIIGDETQIPFAKLIPLKKIKENHFNWQELKSHWKSTLENLSDDFCNGQAAVDPVNEQACLHCDFNAICRID